MEKREITLSLYPHQARAIALFAKRTYWDIFESLSVNEEEAYLLRDSLYEVWDQLEKHGFAPR